MGLFLVGDVGGDTPTQPAKPATKGKPDQTKYQPRDLSGYITDAAETWDH